MLLFYCITTVEKWKNKVFLSPSFDHFSRDFYFHSISCLKRNSSNWDSKATNLSLVVEFEFSCFNWLRLPQFRDQLCHSSFLFHLLRAPLVDFIFWDNMKDFDLLNSLFHPSLMGLWFEYLEVRWCRIAFGYRNKNSSLTKADLSNLCLCLINLERNMLFCMNWSPVKSTLWLLGYLSNHLDNIEKSYILIYLFIYLYC